MHKVPSSFLLCFEGTYSPRPVSSGVNSFLYSSTQRGGERFDGFVHFLERSCTFCSFISAMKLTWHRNYPGKEPNPTVLRLHANLWAQIILEWLNFYDLPSLECCFGSSSKQNSTARDQW